MDPLEFLMSCPDAKETPSIKQLFYDRFFVHRTWKFAYFLKMYLNILKMLLSNYLILHVPTLLSYISHESKTFLLLMQTVISVPCKVTEHTCPDAFQWSSLYISRSRKKVDWLENHKFTCNSGQLHSKVINL